MSAIAFPIFVQAAAMAPVPRPPSIVFECPHLLQSRTPLPTQKIAPTGLIFLQNDLSWQTADPAFGNSWVASNKDYLFVQNTSLTLTLTVTVRSCPEPSWGRLGDMKIVLAPGVFQVSGPIAKLGWMQLDGSIYVDSPAGGIQLLVATFA
jgi:hypothetical protein